MQKQQQRKERPPWQDQFQKNIGAEPGAEPAQRLEVVNDGLHPRLAYLRLVSTTPASTSAAPTA